MSEQSFIGPIIHSTNEGQLIIHKNAQINIKDGKIHGINLNPDTVNINDEKTRKLKNGQFLIPGFIDGHIHAVQFPNLGLGYDKDLLGWLETYTFPVEKKFSDKEFAEKVCDAVVRRTIKCGTTTACYYSSLHESASFILAQNVVKYGQRALVGKVNMNVRNGSDYFESRETSLKDTERFIENIAKTNSPLVKPIITPRFALSCDMELMKMLGDLARTKNIHIQTHIAETKAELEAVKIKYPAYSSYAAVYDDAGLLTDKTILAHGIYLTDDELDIIRNRKSSIIHCPSSNTNLRSGLCDVRRLLAANIKVGLGTDVSGGNSPCILDTMRAVLQVSSHLSIINSNYEPLDYKDVFHLATLGGATAIGLEDKVGSFELGKEFDALVIDVASSESVIDNLKNYTLEEQFQRFIYSGDDRNIVEVYVSGKLVM